MSLLRVGDSHAGGRADSLVSVARLFTAAWYGDSTFELTLPDDWDVDVFWPHTPAELSDEDIRAAILSPVGQPPIHQLARGKVRPVLVVDDPTRPTPVDRVLSTLLDELELGGVPASAVTVVIATGTHGPPQAAALTAKVGEAKARGAAVHVHDHMRDVRRVGRTRFGTPVYVDRVVAASDLVIGVGGVYPQHMAWFGGGSKVVLGVLGQRSIERLHFANWDLGHQYSLANRFRADLDEIAGIVGMRTCVSVHVNQARRPVRVVCGDPRLYYEAAARFSREIYAAPAPGKADVVVSNAYPMDTSVTFAQSKGMTPLRLARAESSKILIAGCPEGAGHHGLFPLFRVPPRHYEMQRLHRAWLNRQELPRKIGSRLRRLRRQPSAAPAPAPPARPIHLFRTFEPRAEIAGPIPGLHDVARWDEVMSRVVRERDGHPVHAVVYPCAPLQVLSL